MPAPFEICIHCPECKKYVKATLVGEHKPYWVYECSECGYHLLVVKAEVWRFEDFTPCQTQRGGVV